MTHPNREEILEILKEIENKENKGEVVANKGLPANASPIDKMKYQLCQNISKYKRLKGFSNIDLSKLLKIDPSMISRITHCHIEKFKVDSLLTYYQVILLSLKEPSFLKHFEEKLSDLIDNDFMAS